MRYAWSGDDGMLTDMIWHYLDSNRNKVEREVRFTASMMRFRRCHVTAPVPEVPNNPGEVFSACTCAPVFDGASMINLQARHCTTLTVQALVNVDGLRAVDFQPGALRAVGR